MAPSKFIRSIYWSARATLSDRLPLPLFGVIDLRMKQLLVVLLSSGISFGVFLGSAQAFDLSVVGGADFATPSVSLGGASQTGISAKAGFGGGLLVGFDLNPVTELEIGALYMGRHFTAPTSTGQEEDSYYSYEIPVVLRLIPLKYITFGLGLYYALPEGNDSQTATPTGGAATSSSPVSTSVFKSDLGGLGSLAVKFPLGIASSFLVDARYYYGFTNASQIAGTAVHYRDVQILAGIDFGF
jgi:hypothetical protein